MMPHPERVFRTVSNSWHPELGRGWPMDGVFSAMRVSSWGKSSAHWFCSPDAALSTNHYHKLPTPGAFLCL